MIQSQKRVAALNPDGLSLPPWDSLLTWTTGLAVGED